MKTRLLLIAVCCIAVIPLTFRSARALDKELGIGSTAPALDIEHWIQDGNGFFKPVKEFKDGKVYVVEFWATWCGPCIASMPHLAELQKKYRGRGVQIISVSDETVDEVKDLLLKENEQEGKTFAEITSSYSLTTDPDKSVYQDYMDAANQEGIPTSFIVGKTGQIEWIGHPMELDEPLEAVVEGTWDREEYKKVHEAEQDFEKSIQQISMLAGAEKFDDAIKLAEKKMKSVEVDEFKDRWMSVRNSLKLSAGKVDDEVIAYYRKEIAKMKGNPVAIGRFSFSLYGVLEGGGKAGPLAEDAIKALESECQDADDEIKPFLYNALAKLCDATGKLKQAIKAQQQAIEFSEGRQKLRLEQYLEQLQEKLAEEK